MENLEEKKQNNRREDERKPQDSKDKTTPSEKLWDPERDSKDEELENDEKLSALKHVRKPQDSDTA